MKKNTLAVLVTALAYSLALLAMFMAVPVFAQDGGAVVTAPVLPDPGAAPVAFAKDALGAVMNSNWKYLGALLLIGAIFVMRNHVFAKIPKIGPKLEQLISTTLGGFVFNIAISAAGMVSTALAAGQPVTLDTVVKVLELSFLAAGGWHVAFKNLPSLGGIGGVKEVVDAVKRPSQAPPAPGA